MIECPICHVMNEEQAHFCSECGQRFAPSAPQPGVQNSNFPAPEPAFPSFPPPESPSFQPQHQPQPAPEQSFQAPPVEQPSYQYTEIPPQQPAFAPPPVPHNPLPFGGGEHTQQIAPQAFPPEPLTNSPPPLPPPQPSQPASPLPSRPKLHSPLFDGPDAAQPIDDRDDRSRSLPPKPANPSGKQRGLRSPLLGDEEDDVPPPQPRGKGGLRSPLLRGDDDEDMPPAQAKGKGGLRSPLLGGDDDYAPQSPQKPARPAKPPQPRSGSGTHLRSPLLGGVDDYEGDDDVDVPPPQGRSTFPHVRRPTKDLDQPVDQSGSPQDQSGSGRMSGKHLRSPLLGGGDEDEEPPVRNPSGRFNTGNRPKLHSPVLDGAGAQNFDYENDEPYYEEIDDPNVLRSPLLAARTKTPIEPNPAPPPEAPPVVSRQKPPPPPLPPQPEPRRLLPPEPAQSFPNPGPSQADFRDRGFPEPAQPPGDMWRERGFQESPRVPLPAPTPPEVAPTIKESSPASTSLRKSSRSGLLPKSDSFRDDDEPVISDLRHQHQAPSQPSPALMPLMAVSCVAIIAKLWYMSSMGAQLMTPPYFPLLVDQLVQIGVMGALIFFAVTAAKR